MTFKEFYLLEDKYIDPITGKNWRYVDKWRHLEAIVKDESKKGIPPARIWVTYSNVPKLGFYPRSSHGAEPNGVFAYPAIYLLDKKEAPFAGNRAYMIAFKVKGSVGELG